MNDFELYKNGPEGLTEEQEERRREIADEVEDKINRLEELGYRIEYIGHQQLH